MERTITMLIADDSPISQDILREAARSTKLPLRFTCTDNGREYLTLLNGANIDLAYGLRSPNLKLNSSEPNFDVAIEGSTIRVAHKSSGHIFEYLWSQTPPYLRNAVVRCASAAAIAPGRTAPVAQETALMKLRHAHLLAT